MHVAIRNVKRQSTLTAILIVLLHYGADPDLPDANGITVRGLLADSPTLLALVETRGGRNLLPYMAAHPSSSTTSAENNEASFIVNTVRNTLLQPDRCDEMMMQTIMSAVHEDDRSAAILWLLMENGAAFHCTSDMSAILYNAIQILACYEGGRPDKCMAQLCILLEKGVNPNLIVSTETHETALHVAIRQSRCRDIMGAAVLMLLMRGANPNAQDIEGKTPMHYAVRVDNVQFGTFLVLLLIDKGGDPNIVDARGRTPLHSALYKRKGIEMYEAFLDNGGTNFIKDRAGNTPLDIARAQADVDGIEVIERWLHTHGRKIQRAAFAQSLHPRLGRLSPAHALNDDLTRRICDTI